MTENLEHVPALGLVLEHHRHRVTRENGSFVELGGNCKLWKLLAALCKRCDHYCPARDLRAEVWEGYLIEEGTLWGAVSDLRKRLRPLGIAIKHVKGLGYRLEDLRIPVS
jgi:DNA-binding winged helix-turn-helix (wHTH) protein